MSAIRQHLLAVVTASLFVLASAQTQAFIYLDTFGFDGPLFSPGAINDQGGAAETPHTLVQPPVDHWASSAATAQQPQIISVNGNQMLELDAINRTGSASRQVVGDFDNMSPGFASMTLNVSDIPDSRQRFLHYSRIGGGDPRLPLIIEPVNGGTQFQLGIDNLVAMSDPVFATVILDPGVDYIVMRYWNITTGTAQLWINPDEMDETSPDTFFTGRNLDIPRQLNFLQTNGAGYRLTIDNLMIASTFAEAWQPIPEPASLALLGAGIALILGGRHRRCRA